MDQGMDILNKHLPRILDLAGNFNIDISEVLTEYAKMLRDDVPEFMDSFTFSEAALLVQHCSEIYARKVDYLHRLVLEMSGNMNVRLHGSESEEPQNQDNVVTKPKRTPSRSKPAFSISLEEFQLADIKLDKPQTMSDKEKWKVRRKLCREATCVSLLYLPRKNELHIYEDDEYASIGLKNQYRVNWPIRQNCRLEEEITDSQMWSTGPVCDGVQNMLTLGNCDEENMPTSDYIDEGIVDEDEEIVEAVSAIEACSASVQVADKTPTSNAMAGITEEPETETALGPLFTPALYETQPEKPQARQKSTFKLPFELSKRGKQNAKPELCFSAFLFSDMLKRYLKMKNVLPRERKHDKKLIAEHIAFIKKRYNLENREEVTRRSLVEQRADFLGFDEVVLPDINDAQNDAEYEPAEPVIPSDSHQLPDCDFDNDCNDIDTGDAGSCNDNLVSDLEQSIVRNERRITSMDIPGVSEWRKFMQSRLASEDAKKPYDINQYGSDILNSFHDVGETLSFKELAGGHKASEVCRYFLSTLMLANKNNVTLDHDGPNTLKVTLQHRVFDPHEEDCESIPGLPKQSGAKRIHDGTREELPDKRFKKQIAGKGPWKIKSKKGSNLNL